MDFNYNVGLGTLKTSCDSLNVGIINKPQRICAKVNEFFKHKDTELQSVLWWKADSFRILDETLWWDKIAKL